MQTAKVRYQYVNVSPYCFYKYNNDAQPQLCSAPGEYIALGPVLNFISFIQWKKNH